MSETAQLTRVLAEYSVRSRFQDLPREVRHAATQGFLNWVGVAVGGCHEEAVRLVVGLAADIGGKPQAAIIGHGVKTDVATAALANCTSSAVFGYDDAHPSSVAHPSAPAAAALFALAQNRRVSGPEFLNAFALAIELQCRLANVLALPPSNFNQNLYLNGFSAPIGVAAGAGRLLGLDETKMAWALGIAATQACGLRAIHGTMSSQFRPGHAARSGVVSALLAAAGFDCTDDSLECDGGFLEVFAPQADIALATVDLGARHEMLANRYKAYPCGVVIHPTIEALLDIRSRLPSATQIAQVRLQVNPLTINLTGIRAPRTSLESLVSVYHWAAAALLRGATGLAVTQAEFLFDPDVVRLREKIEARADAQLAKGEAKAEVTLANGSVIASHAVSARGSLARPMSDSDLDAKFLELTARAMSPEAGRRLCSACWKIAEMGDVGAEIGRLLP